MNSRSVLFFLTVAALAALCIAAPSGGDTYPQGPCEPGSEATYQCNTCTCSQDGTGYACTRQICPPPSRERRQTSCEPGRTYPSPDNCNTCMCTSTRVLACTALACITGPLPSK